MLASRLRAALGDHAGLLVRTPAGFSLQAEPVDLIAAERALAPPLARTTWFKRIED